MERGIRKDLGIQRETEVKGKSIETGGRVGRTTGLKAYYMHRCRRTTTSRTRHAQANEQAKSCQLNVSASRGLCMRVVRTLNTTSSCDETILEYLLRSPRAQALSPDVNADVSFADRASAGEVERPCISATCRRRRRQSRCPIYNKRQMKRCDSRCSRLSGRAERASWREHP